MTDNTSFNQNTAWGGTWKRIQTGRFLVAAGGGINPTTDGASDKANDGNANWYSVGEKNGVRNVTLTTSQIPAHNHPLNKNVPYGIPYNNTSGAACGAGSGPWYGESYSPFSIGNTGGGGSHENRPPYISVYMWKRTA